MTLVEQAAQKAEVFAKELEAVCRKHGIVHTVRVETGFDAHEFPGLNDAERYKWVFVLHEYEA